MQKWKLENKNIYHYLKIPTFHERESELPFFHLENIKIKDEIGIKFSRLRYYNI